jgi:hypothetical protein
MPYISFIIAKALALTDFFLEQWVDVGVGLSVSPNGCYAIPTVQANVNACGQEFLTNVTDIVEGLVALVPSLLAGLFSSGAPAAERWLATFNRLLLFTSRILPGDWGKVGPGWLVLPFWGRAERFDRGGNIHQFLWRRSRAVSNAKTGTVRPGAIRNRSESSQVARGSFDLGRIAVTIAYPVATVYQHGRAALAVRGGGGQPN